MGQSMTIGGQAVIEGVMMRGPRFFTVAVRRQSGEIIERTEPVDTVLGRFRWLDKPFLRGTLALIDALALGMKALSFSANVAMEDATASEREAGAAMSKSVNDIAVGTTMVLGLAVGVVIFIGLPSMGAGVLKSVMPSGFWLNVAEGLLRLALFVGYVYAVSLMPDIRRVFQYHGAEHKVVNTYEAGEELTVANAAKHTTFHPRCGTSFLLVVLIVATLTHMVMGWPEWHVRLLSRIAVLPIVAGISFEVIRAAGRRKKSRLWRAALAPGLWTQRITTKEPTPEQLEVAIRSLKAVLEREHLGVSESVCQA
ncbi:MAG: DUF1385 domain-containing protein [Armatimonadota bacterium]